LAKANEQYHYLHELQHFTYVIYHFTRIICIPNLHGDAPEGLAHLWENIKQRANPDFQSWSTYILFDVPSIPQNNPFFRLTFGCNIIQKLIKECTGFTAMINRIADGNDRKYEFTSHLGTSQEPLCFNFIYSTEQVTPSPGNYKTKPTYAYIISEVHFKALFGKDFEDLEHEDERKKVLPSFQKFLHSHFH
jgi:hypothetical protein